VCLHIWVNSGARLCPYKTLAIPFSASLCHKVGHAAYSKTHSGSALVGVVIVACQRGVTRTCQGEIGNPALWLVRAQCSMLGRRLLDCSCEQLVSVVSASGKSAAVGVRRPFHPAQRPAAIKSTREVEIALTYPKYAAMSKSSSQPSIFQTSQVRSELSINTSCVLGWWCHDFS
jgi:hypothetical protein